jgi:uncharacterized protein
LGKVLEPNPRRFVVKPLPILAGALVVIGGLNWGLVALAEFDLVAWVVGLDFGETNAVSRIVYGLVGISAAYLAVTAGMRRSPAGRIESASSHA